MNATIGSVTQAPSPPRWLILIHQLPPKPDYLRVKVRRRLQRLGAIALKNTVYLLPATDEAREDFHWLRGEIVSDGGEATLCEATFLAGVEDDELRATFRRDREAEYAELAAAIADAGIPLQDAESARFRRHLAEVVRRDHSGAEGRTAVEHALARGEGLAGKSATTPAPGRTGGVTPPQGATWVTRAGVFVDRMASAWLIGRFIDPAARFKFVPATGYRPQPGELRFDMFEGEFTHEGDACTFETLVRRFCPEDPGLRAVGEVVHDIDCKDDKFSRPETAGVAMVLRGIALQHQDDSARLAQAGPVFDALHAHLAGLPV